MQLDQKANQDPKSKQFLDQLQELCDAYQYVLTPSLSYTTGGITPTLRLVNKVPEKVAVKKKPIRKAK